MYANKLGHEVRPGDQQRCRSGGDGGTADDAVLLFTKLDKVDEFLGSGSATCRLVVDHTLCDMFLDSVMVLLRDIFIFIRTCTR